MTDEPPQSVQASLFLNGNGAGEGSHLSIYIKILPGEYDALLRWPFAHTVSFTLYDQAPTPEAVSTAVTSVGICWNYRESGGDGTGG